MATKKKVKVTAKSANMLDTKGRVTNVKAKKVSVKVPVARAAPTPKATPTPKAAPAPRQTDAYGRLTNNSTPVWNQPGGVQPGLMQRIQPVGTPITFTQQQPTALAYTGPQQQDWMQPAGDYNGAPEYKPPKLTNVKTQYKTPKW